MLEVDGTRMDGSSRAHISPSARRVVSLRALRQGCESRACAKGSLSSGRLIRSAVGYETASPTFLYSSVGWYKSK